jgi:hypothetical protein
LGRSRGVLFCSNMGRCSAVGNLRHGCHRSTSKPRKTAFSATRIARLRGNGKPQPVGLVAGRQTHHNRLIYCNLPPNCQFTRKKMAKEAFERLANTRECCFPLKR